jgi:hypothetical protein
MEKSALNFVIKEPIEKLHARGDFLKEHNLNLVELAPAAVMLKNLSENKFSIFFLKFESGFESVESMAQQIKGFWKARLVNGNGENTPVTIESKGSNPFSVQVDSGFGEFSVKKGEKHWAGGLVGKILGKIDGVSYLGRLSRNKTEKDLYIIDFRNERDGNTLKTVDWIMKEIANHPNFTLASGSLSTEIYK